MKNEPEIKRISVSCYSGCQYAERPASFTENEKVCTVKEIIDRWYEGGVESGREVLSYFKVRTEEDIVHILRYHPVLDEWYLMR